MDNYQDNDNNNEHINGRKILINEEVYDEIGIGGWQTLYYFNTNII